MLLAKDKTLVRFLILTMIIHGLPVLNQFLGNSAADMKGCVAVFIVALNAARLVLGTAKIAI